MNVDETQSLAQLTGIDWGAPPEGSSTLIAERHEFRRTPLSKLSIAALQRMLLLDFEDDRLFLIPCCLKRIEADNEIDLNACGLLLSVLTSEHYDWLQKPDLVCKARNLVNKMCHALYLSSNDAEQTDDSLEYYKVLLPNTQMRASLYEALATFEQRISKIEPDYPPKP